MQLSCTLAVIHCLSCSQPSRPAHTVLPLPKNSLCLTIHHTGWHHQMLAQLQTHYLLLLSHWLYSSKPHHYHTEDSVHQVDCYRSMWRVPMFLWALDSWFCLQGVPAEPSDDGFGHEYVFNFLSATGLRKLNQWMATSNSEAAHGAEKKSALNFFGYLASTIGHNVDIAARFTTLEISISGLVNHKIS